MNRHELRPSLHACSFVVAIVVLASSAFGAEPRVPALFERVDQAIDSSHVGPPVPMASDADFLRRVSLDLTGVPPSAEELKTFLDDPFADKRTRAVDRLLDSPLFSRHMATILDVMLMERRPYQHVNVDEWTNYLLKGLRENKPLNLLLKEILSTDGADPKLRPAARFYLDRGAEPNLITRDVGRIVFGRDMQCAQCHNHPLIEDYQQSDYHGLLAFFSPSYALTRKENGKDKMFYAEKAGGDLAFDSVFVKDDKHLTGPRILGTTEMVEPIFPPGEEYKVNPAGNVMPVPKFSRRAELAANVTGGSNKAFNENIANRLWGVMMGRGLIHPFDLHHPANPPSQPELLKFLGEELVALNFDAKAFLRELALSKAYQRSIDLPADHTNSAEIASTLSELKTHTDTLTATSQAAKKAYEQAVKVWHAAETLLVPAISERDQALAKYDAAAKKMAEAQNAVDDLASQINTKQELAKALAEVAGKAQDVSKKLAAEKDLAAAAQKFSDRLKAMTTEVAALQKASTDKAAALKKVVEEVAATVKPVEVARAKVLPLRDTVRAKEKDVHAARVKMAETRVVLEAHKKRLDLLKAYAARNALNEKAAAMNKALAGRRDGVAQAEKHVSDLATVLAKHKAERDVADHARHLVEKARRDAQAALDRQQKLAASVHEAFNATDAARQQLPDDTTLAETVPKLKAKAGELQSVTVGLASLRDTANAALKKAADALAAVNRTLDESNAEKSRREKALAAVRTALSGEEGGLKALQSEIAAANEELATLMGNQFSLAQLKPLSPEQMCWSILKVTGVYDRYRQAEEAELNKTKPLNDAAKKDPAQIKARVFEVEQRTFDKLKGNVGTFVTIYGAAAGQPQNDFFATADQALFAANGGAVNGWVAPAGGNVTQRMVAEKDSVKAAEDLYLTVLSRPPTPEESADVARVLTAQISNKPAAVQELAWGLLTSAEFRFNH